MDDRGARHHRMAGRIRHRRQRRRKVRAAAGALQLPHTAQWYHSVLHAAHLPAALRPPGIALCAAVAHQPRHTCHPHRCSTAHLAPASARARCTCGAPLLSRPSSRCVGKGTDATARVPTLAGSRLAAAAWFLHQCCITPCWPIPPCCPGPAPSSWAPCCWAAT